jgi:HEAT repeat protein
MGHTLAASDAARYAELAAGLYRSLETNADPDARAVALKALANTRDAALAPVAERHLDAPQPAVRAAAAQALAAMDREGSLGPMTDRLAREPDGRVRTAMVDGMRAMSHRSDRAFAACAAMLEQERDPDARNALARYLVDNLQRYPQGREPLARLLQTESQPGIVAYVAGRLHRAKHH